MMLRSLLLCALLLGVVRSDDSAVEQFTQEENVLVLKTDNFEDALKLDFLLVDFCECPAPVSPVPAGLEGRPAFHGL